MKTCCTTLQGFATWMPNKDLEKTHKNVENCFASEEETKWEQIEGIRYRKPTLEVQGEDEERIGETEC